MKKFTFTKYELPDMKSSEKVSVIANDDEEASSKVRLIHGAGIYHLSSHSGRRAA